MNRIQRSIGMAAAGALMLSATAASAQSTRPGSSVPMVSEAVTAKMATRTTKPVKAAEQVVGGSLILLLLGVGASIVAIAAVAGGNDSRG